MIPASYPFRLKDVYREVYWVDGWFDDLIDPPLVNGTVFRHEEPLSEPFPMVDIEGHRGRQRFYSSRKTQLNWLAYDSNFMALSIAKSKFLGYEHRIPIKLRQAVHGYSTWDEIKSICDDVAVSSNAILAYRNRPVESVERVLYGNAYLGGSTYYEGVFGAAMVDGVKWAFLGHYDRSNIPCGRGLFIYRTLSNGGIVESENQFCTPISAEFTGYTVDVAGDAHTEVRTLYYHPSDNLWKDAVDGNPVTGFYHHPDILPGSFDAYDPFQSFVYQIVDGNITENLLYIPITVGIKVLFAEGEWVNGTKKQSVTSYGLFEGKGYRANGDLISEPFLEAVYVNGGYKHETWGDYSYWGENPLFWTATGGLKQGTTVVERTIPFIT